MLESTMNIQSPLGALDSAKVDMMAGLPRSTSVVIPVYNEEENIPAVYAAVKAALNGLDMPWELIFVDDGSSDAGASLMASIAMDDARVKLIKLRRNFGQTAAMVAGMDHARGTVIVPLDADLQNDPLDIPRLLAKLEEGYDIVSGWRKFRKDPLSKRLPSIVANKLATWVTGVHLHDHGCTLKAYRRDVLAGVHIYGEMHRFIPALASSVGARIGELEITHHPRMFGKSKYGIGRTLRVVLDLMTLKLLLTYYNRPMRLFGGVGLFLMTLGGLSGAATLLMKILMGVDMTGNPLLFMTVLGLISGFQLIGLGFLAEINMRTYYETQRKSVYVVREIVEQAQEKA